MASGIACNMQGWRSTTWTRRSTLRGRRTRNCGPSQVAYPQLKVGSMGSPINNLCIERYGFKLTLWAPVDACAQRQGDKARVNSIDPQDVSEAGQSRPVCTLGCDILVQKVCDRMGVVGLPATDTCYLLAGPRWQPPA